MSNSIPKSSSIKMIDIWMLASLLVPFVDVLIQVHTSILYFNVY